MTVHLVARPRWSPRKSRPVKAFRKATACLAAEQACNVHAQKVSVTKRHRAANAQSRLGVALDGAIHHGRQGRITSASRLCSDKGLAGDFLLGDKGGLEKNGLHCLTISAFPIVSGLC